MARQSIDELLENAAEHGETEFYQFIWKRTINRLRKNGLIVEEKYAGISKGRIYCKVDWSQSECRQNDENLNQANRLFKMAQEAKNRK